MRRLNLSSTGFLIGFLVFNAYLISIAVADAPKIITKDPVDSHHKKEVLRYKVADIDYTHVEKPFMLAVWVLLASFAKIGFHLSPKPSAYVPESCMLILLGVLTGCILFFSKVGHLEYTLSTSVFFLFLLPPIVLEAGYFMPRRPFFENIGTILLLAVVGTLWNTLTMGFALWGISKTGLYGLDIPLLHCLLFSALISAVDPVAILAVFEEAQVNEVLHIIVFGESLLNDGVAVVLYNMFGTYSKIGVQNIIPQDIVAGVASFFVVALGGTFIGVAFAFFTGWLTKYTEKVTVIEPLFVFILAYVSYLVGDMFKLSGILAIVFCGLIMRKYVEANISPQSTTTVKYTMKMLSSTCESIIFLFLGLSTVVDTHVWNTGFTLFSIFFCIFFRGIGILVMIPLLNRQRLVKMNKVDIFIMIYGGLRGAISFSLAMLLDEDSIGVNTKRMFVTTTVTVVIFTSFFQGLTIRPLVEILQVKKASPKNKNMCEILLERCFDHLLVGIEDLIGARGRNRVRDRFEGFETKYIKPYLMKSIPNRENKLVEVCTKLNLKEAGEYIKQYGDIKTMKRDISVQDSMAEMPVIDTTHLDPVYSNREETDRWHYMIEDIMCQPRQKVKKYSRHMLFDNPSQPPGSAYHNRHTSKLKTMRPLLDPSASVKRKNLVNGSVVSKSTGIRSPASRITGALRRLSISLASPTRVFSKRRNSKGESVGEEDGGLFFATTPLKNGQLPRGSPERLGLNPPTSQALQHTAKSPVSSPSGGSNKHVNFAIPDTKKLTDKTKDILKYGTVGKSDESQLLINDETDTSNESPPKTKSPSSVTPSLPPPLPKNVTSTPKSASTQPKPGEPKPSESKIPQTKPTETGNLIDIEDKVPEDKQKSETSQEPTAQDESNTGAPSRKGSLTIAEKALPWKTPSPHPQKMPNPPRKLSDAYVNAPSHLSSILDHNPQPPISNKEVLQAKGKLPKDESTDDSLVSETTDTKSFVSALPTSSPQNSSIDDPNGIDLQDANSQLSDTIAANPNNDDSMAGDSSSRTSREGSMIVKGKEPTVPTHTFKPSPALLPDKDNLEKDIL